MFDTKKTIQNNVKNEHAIKTVGFLAQPIINIDAEVEMLTHVSNLQNKKDSLNKRKIQLSQNTPMTPEMEIEMKSIDDVILAIEAELNKYDITPLKKNDVKEAVDNIVTATKEKIKVLFKKAHIAMIPANYKEKLATSDGITFDGYFPIKREDISDVNQPTVILKEEESIKVQNMIDEIDGITPLLNSVIAPEVKPIGTEEDKLPGLMHANESIYDNELSVVNPAPSKEPEEPTIKELMQMITSLDRRLTKHVLSDKKNQINDPDDVEIQSQLII